MRRLVAARNLLKAWAFAFALTAVFALVGWGLDGVRGLSIFVFCGLLFVGGAYWLFDRVALAMAGARELPFAEAPLLHSTVERLAALAGVVKPRLYLIPDGLPRALASGRSRSSSSLAVSAGLLSACPPAELEGVIAHELAHVRLHDVQVQTAASVLAGSMLEASRIGGFLERALLFVLGPIASACVHLLLSPKREFEADRMAAALCGSPHGLADALVRLEQAAELVDFQGSPATEPLYTINPFLERGIAALFVTHPPVAERVRRLRDLDPAWREKLRGEAAA
ncbi:MAG TPA: M48 family metalloprotease [Gaiellaceae bacterium]|nr:M48 family metalloprotease [Gaiellaceae bacterium]